MSMMKIWQEFKEFAVKGNAIDLAVGIIIGAGFNAIVQALVDNIIMPPLGLLTGGIDFSNQQIVIKAATESSEAIAIGYGVLINTLLEFVIIAFAVFMVVRYINKLKREEEPAEKIPERKCSYCKQAIDTKATRCPHCTANLQADNT
jgi:large conductance mechanosensitive channel